MNRRLEGEGGVYDPFGLVRCLACNGKGQHRRDNRRMMTVRMCRECSGTGEVLAGDPPGTGYVLTLDFCRGTWPCCHKEVANRGR